MSTDIYAKLEEQIDKVEAEMRKIGFWSDEKKEVNQSELTAFGANKLKFEEWLQFVFVPNVRKLIAEKGELPKGSQVGLMASKEYEQMGEVTKAIPLVRLLQDFDVIVEGEKGVT